jgi:hypothetical protein
VRKSRDCGGETDMSSARGSISQLAICCLHLTCPHQVGLHTTLETTSHTHMHTHTHLSCSISSASSWYRAPGRFRTASGTASHAVPPPPVRCLPAPSPRLPSLPPLLVGAACTASPRSKAKSSFKLSCSSRGSGGSRQLFETKYKWRAEISEGVKQKTGWWALAKRSAEQG